MRCPLRLQRRQYHLRLCPLGGARVTQRRLAENDALNEYPTHTGSAEFACPAGASVGGYVGGALLG